MHSSPRGLIKGYPLTLNCLNKRVKSESNLLDLMCLFFITNFASPSQNFCHIHKWKIGWVITLNHSQEENSSGPHSNRNPSLCLYSSIPYSLKSMCFWSNCTCRLWDTARMRTPLYSHSNQGLQMLWLKQSFTHFSLYICLSPLHSVYLTLFLCVFLSVDWLAKCSESKD